MSTSIGNPFANCIENALGQFIGDKETRDETRQSIATGLDNLLKNVAATAGSSGLPTSKKVLGWEVISGVSGAALGEVGGTIFNKTIGKFFCDNCEHHCSSTNSVEEDNLLDVSTENADRENQQQSTLVNGNHCTFSCRKLTRATVAGTVATISGAIILNWASAGTVSLVGVGYSAASITGGYITGKLSDYLFSKCSSMTLPNNENLVGIKKVLGGTQNFVSVTASTGIAYGTSAAIHYFIDFLQGDPDLIGSGSGGGSGNSTLTYA